MNDAAKYGSPTEMKLGKKSMSDSWDLIWFWSVQCIVMWCSSIQVCAHQIHMYRPYLYVYYGMNRGVSKGADFFPGEPTL